ncbi:hypothetical protein ALC62_02302, partial [Cyphomyrmex costatus]
HQFYYVCYIIQLPLNQFGVANSDDFWSSMQSALDESDVLHKDYKIKEVMDTWMNQDRYPILAIHMKRIYILILTNMCFRIPQYQNFVYCPGLMTANRTIWDKMLEIYLKKDPFTKSFPDKEHCLAFIYIIEKHARNDLILDHILTNFEILKPKLLTISAIITKILENIYSDEQIEKVNFIILY